MWLTCIVDVTSSLYEWDKVFVLLATLWAIGGSMLSAEKAASSRFSDSLACQSKHCDKGVSPDLLMKPKRRANA